MPSHLSQEFKQLLKTLLHADAAWRPHAREIVRHPLLCGLMLDESIACLRAQPPSPTRQRTGATQMQSASELMASVQKAQNRALKAEKDAARLRTALQAAQHEAAMWQDRTKLLEQQHAAAAAASASAMQHSHAQTNPYVSSSPRTNSHALSHAHAHERARQGGTHTISSAGTSGGHTHNLRRGGSHESHTHTGGGSGLPPTGSSSVAA